ncbi:glycosyltransferase family 1 protein [Clostridium sp.]|uniref:glycosyltransferase family 1 protein n=1 Tax=Clostridium sp. TaxID=1506 RepID=UPI00261251BF|nr:glycosyltransferase family 1 protein [Clostridium sp.]
MNKPIRVGVVIGKWINYGVETLVLNCYRNIDKSKIQFDFIIDEDSGATPTEEIESMGGRVIIVPPYQKPIRYHKALVKLFRDNEYKIVHAHTSTLCVFPLWAAKSAQVPIRIAHCHTTAGKGEYLKNIIKYSLRPFSMMYPTHLAASSHFGGEWLFGKGCFEKYDMYYLPVARDIEQFIYNEERRNKIRKELGVVGKFVVGHLGRFVPQKNHMFLIDVFKEIHSMDSNAVLLLAGDGELIDDVLKKVNKLGLTEYVLFLGRRSDASNLYQAMDVFILPSLYEGVPGTGIEAQSAGLPFIYSNTVTDEARILSTTFRLPLDVGAKKWAETAIDSKQHPRENTYQEMTDAGYNIKVAARELENYYIGLVENLKLLT